MVTDDGLETDVGVIRRLPDEVVRNIAAGEVIVNATAALKEILENSIDAGASSINISTRRGGMKLLQVVDNGRGISRADLPLVCERFATSKLRTCEDLQQIGTFGFRGEALASISQVARVTVTSMAHDAECAYSAYYTGGKLTAKPGSRTIEPQPCAGVPGTSIAVEDLFYNMPTRRGTVRSAGDEYRAMIDIIAKYSIHYAGIAFSCRKLGEASEADVRTETSSSTFDNIRAAYGKGLAQEILEFNFSLEEEEIEANGYVSNANFSTKRKVFILFINGRLVDHSPLRRAIESVHAEFTPKSSFGFCYLNLKMNPQNVDVNVHPTKREVRFLHADRLIDTAAASIAETMKSYQTSRNYFAQTVIGSQVSSAVHDETPALQLTQMPAKDPRKFVRTDARTQAGAMETFLQAPQKRRSEQSLEQGSQAPRKKRLCSTGESRVSPQLLTSVLQLRSERESMCQAELLDIFKEHTFVGVVNSDFGLIQFRTRLLLLQLRPLMKELMMQRILQQFGAMSRAKLMEPLPICTVLTMRLEMPNSGWKPEHGDRTDVARAVTDLLISRSEMISEYFSIEISVDPDGTAVLTALPIVLEKHFPDPNAVPDLLLRLGTAVDYSQEQNCFRNICEHLAQCYSYLGKWDSSNKDIITAHEHLVKHIVLPATRFAFFPPANFVDNNAVKEITSLERLYKIFERC
eukprot:Plantae.Rhodophyta-Purpureofilum_apyrenoidigerum.ctg375.p1 GENE.Plantae.Rhodophyta-Purpureofilum_apyrenoidigerum.ctg375~~Plantae.Rhodophyta-Purpureofilum_apyrenoidigerum.ctg375.p1  ORF type:complete len:691 (+),score=129.35 Plantae.Rhodophyta-Purpureofilum_apyrenoidigerum.ctg375:95-2167(+)